MKHFNLYQKFALTIILLGLLPMAILSTFIANRMIKNYSEALSVQYEQASGYVAFSIESMLEAYNTISKMPYYYNLSADKANSYLSFDNFRQIIYAEGYAPETANQDRKRDMGNFLQYIQSVDAYINGTHVMAMGQNGEKLSFHYSVYNSFFKDEELFEQEVSYGTLDRSNKNLMLIRPHVAAYFYGTPNMVFTVARNYFDLRGGIGDTPYVGTIFIDIDLKKIEQIFRSVEFTGNEIFYVVNGEGDCFYSNDAESVGENLTDKLYRLSVQTGNFTIRTPENDYGLSVVVVMDSETAFQDIRRMQHMMYVFIAASVAALFAGSFFFSRRLTRPIHYMMEQMAMVETGNFDIELPVYAKDEIGVLSQRFNQMGSALKTYINQSYVAQIKQNEAELTALKSQIYPHFLYNTLEIIRMTALEEEGCGRVPQMIEALAEQIHYLIGPMKDLVPLEQEIDIVKKYVYLLNCRISGNIQLMMNITGFSKAQVPKLILQPIVENAYVHGIKPKNGVGCIMIEAAAEADYFEVGIMDNGTGMSGEELRRINHLLEGDEPGIKNEYNWQSIGLKNVHDRIRLLYGEEYGIRITSTPSVGTRVRVLLPLTVIQGEKEEKI